MDPVVGIDRAFWYIFIVSAIFLAEIPHWYHYLGICLIFSGIWLTMKK